MSTPDQPTTQQQIVTVYSKPNCVQCTATYRALDAKGINYQVADLTIDGDALQTMKNLGYLQAPVVIVQDGPDDDWFFEHWAGFRPDKINDLATTTDGDR